ncbi:MAG: DUF4232 domain-containing protein [Brevundimonas sp.]|nr:DUF4232 domain-containing protein [Brevundimonas sp.]
MRRLSPACAFVASLALVAACTEEAAVPPQPVEPSPAPTAPAAPPVSYACESGQSIAVAYPDTSSARLSYKGQTYVLRTAQSASGARYIGSGVEWWTANRDGTEGATLSRLGPDEEIGTVVLERCSRPSSPSVGAGPELVQAPDPRGMSEPPCKGPQLRLSAEGGDAGAGSRVTIIGVQNVGSQACRIHGYPAVALQDAQGRDLEAMRTEQRPGGYSREGQANILVSLAPREKAFFDIAWSAIPHEGQGERVCPKAARIRVTAYGDTSPVTLDQALQPCGGRISVSPVRAEAEPTPVPST